MSADGASATAGGTGTPGPVLVAVAGPAAQRRATVAVRFILAIPHFLALCFLGIAAFAVVVIGWPGALVTGPDFYHRSEIGRLLEL